MRINFISNWFKLNKGLVSNGTMIWHYNNLFHIVIIEQICQLILSFVKQYPIKIQFDYFIFSTYMSYFWSLNSLLTPIEF